MERDGVPDLLEAMRTAPGRVPSWQALSKVDSMDDMCLKVAGSNVIFREVLM